MQTIKTLKPVIIGAFIGFILHEIFGLTLGHVFINIKPKFTEEQFLLYCKLAILLSLIIPYLVVGWCTMSFNNTKRWHLITTAITCGFLYLTANLLHGFIFDWPFCFGILTIICSVIAGGLIKTWICNRHRSDSIGAA